MGQVADTLYLIPARMQVEDDDVVFLALRWMSDAASSEQ